MTTLNVTNLKNASSSSNNLVLNSNGSVTGAGKILQVVQTVKKDVFTTSSSGSSWVEVTGLNVSITPSSTSSKILIDANISYSPGSTTYTVFFSLYDGSTQLTDFIGDAGQSSQTRTTAMERIHANSPGTSRVNALISPSSTSAKTYKIYCLNENNGSLSINQMHANSNYQYFGRSISTITAMEVSA